MATVSPIRIGANELDLSQRTVVSTTVVASPSASSETIIASVKIPDNIAVVTGVLLIAQAAYTVGTSGVSVKLLIRQTDTSGTIVGTTGAITETAANLDSTSVLGWDASPASGQVYKLTMTVASGAAASTVSGLSLVAILL